MYSDWNIEFVKPLANLLKKFNKNKYLKEIDNNYIHGTHLRKSLIVKAQTILKNYWSLMILK